MRARAIAEAWVQRVRSPASKLTHDGADDRILVNELVDAYRAELNRELERAAEIVRGDPRLRSAPRALLAEQVLELRV